MDKLQEDTVSADRKERIIFDPEAWRKSDKSGRRTSAITSRQNFNNEKFTRKKSEDAEEKVDESTQITGTSQIDNGAPSQSDLISKGKTGKSNSPQIEFVTGTEKSKVTQMDNQPRQGVRKIAEGLIKKAIQQVSEGRMKDKVTDADFEPKATDSSKPPFDGPYTKTPDVVVDKSGARHTAYSRVRSLARQALAKQNTHAHDNIQATHKTFKEEAYAGLEKEDKPGKLKTAVVKTHPKAVEVETVEGWKDEKKPVKEEAAIEEARMSAAVKLQRAFEREQAKSAASRQRAQELLNPKKEEPAKQQAVSEAREDAYTRDYKSSVSGFGKHSAAYHADGGANDEGWGNERHKPRSTMDRPHTVHINGKPWKKFSNGHQAHAAVRTLQAKGKDAHAVAHFNEEEETDMSKTYAQFMDQLLEYTPGPGGVTKVKGRSYGANYDAGEGEDDEDKPKAAPAVKRGRGRPAGSKSGANQKVTTGKSYGGIATHSLNLPNSNR
jgi:hypothetical protein